MQTSTIILLVDAGNGNFEEIYPNPSDDSIGLDFDLKKTGNVKIQFINSQGIVKKSINNKNLESGSQTIKSSVNDLTNGFYFVKIQSGSYIKNFKLIVNK